MIRFLAQPSDFELWQRAVRNQFQTGGSITSLVLVVLALAAVILLVALLTRLQNRLRQGAAQEIEYSDPQRLYSHLLFGLGLTVSQRNLMESLAHELKIPQPTALLLSESLFDQHAENWGRGALAGRAMPGGPTTAQLLGQIRTRLFPGGKGIVTSKPAGR